MKHFLNKIYTKLRYGVDCCELASYDYYITAKIAKDLKRFKKECNSYPPYMTWEEWIGIIDKIIFGLEAYKRLNDNDDYIVAMKNEMEAMKEIEEAMHLFAKYINRFLL